MNFLNFRDRYPILIGEVTGITWGSIGSLSLIPLGYSLVPKQVIALNVFSYSCGKIAWFVYTKLPQPMDCETCCHRQANGQTSTNDKIVNSMAWIGALHTLGFVPGYFLTHIIPATKMDQTKAIYLIAAAVASCEISAAIVWLFHKALRIHFFRSQEPEVNSEQHNRDNSTEISSGYLPDDDSYASESAYQTNREIIIPPAGEVSVV